MIEIEIVDLYDGFDVIVTVDGKEHWMNVDQEDTRASLAHWLNKLLPNIKVTYSESY